MPRCNRVDPFGTFQAVAERGLIMGNRGILHDGAGRLGAARWRHAHWVACLISFKGRRAAVNAPGRYTPLFFLDEAVALAAGHRPCAECRRADYGRFREAWRRAQGEAGEGPKAAGLDRVLHAARVTRDRRQIATRAPAPALPDGAFVTTDHEPATARLVWQGRLLRWHPGGYDDPRPIPAQEVTVLTPAPSVLALRAGYRPMVHPSAANGG